MYQAQSTIETHFYHNKREFIFHIEPFLGSSSTISHITSLFHIHHAANAVASLHLLKGSVDGRQRLTVGDELVHLELAVQVVVHETGQLGATLDTTKGTALPHTTGDQLECYKKREGEYKKASEKEV